MFIFKNNYAIKLLLLIMVSAPCLFGIIALIIGVSHNASTENAKTMREHAIQKNQTGVVTHVVDGDTFDVKLNNGKTERVRAILVNTPEICHKSSAPDCEPDPYGDIAATFATDLLEGETVQLEFDKTERDPYDRLLAYVYLDDERMYQELILEEGLAEIMAIKPNVKYQEQLEAIETEARNNRMNLWQN